MPTDSKDLYLTLSPEDQAAFLRYISLISEADNIINQHPVLRETVDRIARFTPNVQRTHEVSLRNVTLTD
jgi:hypothetical protein